MSSIQQCISDELLRSLLDGELSDVAAPGVEQHLQGCAQCQGRLERLAGTREWWSEAHSMLVDYESQNNAAAQQELGDRAECKGWPVIDAYLASWIGPTDDPTKIGRIGPYEIIGVVGYGGAGVVLRGHDIRLNRPVAIKALLPALAHNPLARRRFERESRAAAAITHQNVVPIYAVDTYNDHPYIAMYYVGGQSLQQRLDKFGPLQVAEIVRIASQIARALEAAHAQGVIHRDIKPSNILLENNVDRVFVTDFGLARVADDASTLSGLIAGTPQYMSPEQCHGQQIEPRSDLFSLGSVMYAMCTGRPPFRSTTIIGMLRRVCETAPTSIREQNPEIPAWLEAFVLRLLSKSPAERFASAGEVANLLERELAHVNSPTTAPAPARRWLIDPVDQPSFEATSEDYLGDRPWSRKAALRFPFMARIGNRILLGVAVLMVAAAIVSFLPRNATIEDRNQVTDGVKIAPSSAAAADQGENLSAGDVEQGIENRGNGNRITHALGTENNSRPVLRLESRDGAVLEIPEEPHALPSRRQD